VIYNTCDFIVTRACHEWIRDRLIAAGTPDVTLRISEHADHRWARVTDAAESFRAGRSGAGILASEPMTFTLEWMSRLAGR